MALLVADTLDRRLIAALQCDGRLTAERAASVLGLRTRAVQRRLTDLFVSGVARVIALPPRGRLEGVMILRIKVLRGKLNAITTALAARDDIPFVDVSASGDEIIAVHLASPDPRNSLVFRQLPATSAVTSVTAQTVIHVYADSTDWRLDALTTEERRQLIGPSPLVGERPIDDLDRAIIAVLGSDARTPASSIARRTSAPESTIRRRLTALFDHRQIITNVIVDPRYLGLMIDANVELGVRPRQLDEAGTQLAAHPAVHGALATTGPANLTLAVWLRDIQDLYHFITHDLAKLDVGYVDTVLVGHAVKRLGATTITDPVLPTNARSVRR
jgi:DNA-binding Lrp family transcriptional regulator